MSRTTITPDLLLYLARVRLGTRAPNMRTFTLKDATTISGVRDPDRDRVDHLFGLYEKLVNPLSGAEAQNKRVNRSATKTKRSNQNA